MHIFSRILTKKPEFFYNHEQLNDELRLSDVCVLVRLWVWLADFDMGILEMHFYGP